MVLEENKSFKCEICGLHYSNMEDAEMCQDWCSSHNSCSLEVSSRSLEAERSRLDRK